MMTHVIQQVAIKTGVLVSEYVGARSNVRSSEADLETVLRTD